MKTINNETLNLLKNLITEIDYEESFDEPNTDLVIEDLYKILDILRTTLEV